MKLGRQVVGELGLQLARGLHDQPVAGVGEEGRAGQQAEPLALDGEEGGKVAVEGLAGDVADAPGDGRGAALGVEQRRRPDHPVEGIARAVGLVEGSRDLRAVPVSEEPYPRARREPEEDDGGGGGALDQPAVGDGQQVVGHAAHDRQGDADAGPSGDGAGDDGERDERRREPDEMLLPLDEVERHQERHDEDGARGEELERARAQVRRDGEEPRADRSEGVCGSTVRHGQADLRGAPGISCT